jgi:type VI secretion system protein ImpJ
MRNLPIHWSEGMFLRPQHFQAADRHLTEAISLSVKAGEECSYGIVRLDIDPVALSNRQFELRSCQARMRDGTVVWLEFSEEPDRLSLRDLVVDSTGLVSALDEPRQSKDSVRVFLAIPKLDISAANVSPPASPEGSRWRMKSQMVQDDTSGGNEQSVDFRGLNVRLLLSTDDLSGFEVLPIAQLRRASNREEAPEIDPDYFPPSLSLDAWPPLGRDVVRGTYDLVSRKVELLAEQAVSRQVGFSSSEPGDIDRLFMLSKLLESQAALRVMAFSKGVHPRVAYTELCRLAGQLAVFEPDRRIAELPIYDHDDLATIFRDVKARIEQMMMRVAVLEFEQRYFVGVGPATLSVTLDSKWLENGWHCYVGVFRGDLSEKECQDLLTGPNNLDWKLGSAEEVERLFRLGVPGLQLLPTDRPPRALPARVGWSYYRIGTENPAYKAVQLSQSLAIRLRDSSVANSRTLAGQRRVDVASGERPGALEFAVFAVPN